MKHKFNDGDKIIPMSREFFEIESRIRNSSAILEGYNREIINAKEIIVRRTLKDSMDKEKLDLYIDKKSTMYYYPSNCFKLYIDNDIESYREC